MSEAGQLGREYARDRIAAGFDAQTFRRALRVVLDGDNDLESRTFFEGAAAELEELIAKGE